MYLLLLFCVGIPKPRNCPHAHTSSLSSRASSRQSSQSDLTGSFGKSPRVSTLSLHELPHPRSSSSSIVQPVGPNQKVTSTRHNSLGTIMFKHPECSEQELLAQIPATVPALATSQTSRRRSLPAPPIPESSNDRENISENLKHEEGSHNWGGIRLHKSPFEQSLSHMSYEFPKSNPAWACQARDRSSIYISVLCLAPVVTKYQTKDFDLSSTFHFCLFIWGRRILVFLYIYHFLPTHQLSVISTDYLPPHPCHPRRLTHTRTHTVVFSCLHLDSEPSLSCSVHSSLVYK